MAIISNITFQILGFYLKMKKTATQLHGKSPLTSLKIFKCGFLHVVHYRRGTFNVEAGFLS